MQYRSFLDVWHKCLPHIIFMTPRTDVCESCENYRVAIRQAVTEFDKKRLLAEFSAHVEVAQKECDAYLAAIEKAAAATSEGNVPSFTHITFDFAQQVFLPYHARQVGPLYYKVPLRVQKVGIRDSQPLNEKETISDLIILKSMARKSPVVWSEQK